MSETIDVSLANQDSLFGDRQVVNVDYSSAHLAFFRFCPHGKVLPHGWRREAESRLLERAKQMNAEIRAAAFVSVPTDDGSGVAHHVLAWLDTQVVTPQMPRRGGFSRYTIHHDAFVDDTVSIGDGTRIWQFASVIRHTRLGKNCTVASNVTLDGVYAGNGCIFSPGVDIGPGFKIGDDVFFGPNVVLCNDAWPRAQKTGFDQAALFTKRNIDGNIAVIVEHNVSFGANSVVLPGVRIGMGAMIAAGAVVDRDVPDQHIFKRNGEIVPIDDEETRLDRRMRSVAP